MKKLLALSLVSLSASAFAQSNIYDLMYLPTKGTLSGSTTFSYTSNKYTLDYISNTYSKVKSNTASIQQELSYTAGTDTLVGIIEGYQVDSKVTTDLGPASTSNGVSEKTKSANGFSEPDLFLKQRLLSQESKAVNLDLQASFSPKLSDAKNSTTTKGGDGLRGSSMFELQLEVGKKNPDTQWKFQLNYLRNGEAKSKSAANASNVTVTDSFGMWGGGFTHQWKMSSGFEMNLTAGIAFIDELTIINANDQTKDVIDSSFVVTAGPEFIFNVSEKAMIQLSAMAAVGDDSTFKATNTSNNSTTILMKKDNLAGIFSASAHYEF